MKSRASAVGLVVLALVLLWQGSRVALEPSGSTSRVSGAPDEATTPGVGGPADASPNRSEAGPAPGSEVLEAPAEGGRAPIPELAEPDHARVRFAHSYCAAIARAACDAAETRRCAPAACASHFEERCRTEVLASSTGADDAQLVDEELLAACIDESRDLAASGLAPLGLARSCLRAFVAPVAIGARCGDADLHCALGHGHCDATRACVLSVPGAPCDLECGAGLHCVAGLCREDGMPEGAACALSSSCAPGLVCFEGRCAPLSEARGDPCRRVADP